jgi:mannose/fructose-specific phosphotransferase system component IIA
MSEGALVRGILLTHGSMAHGMADAVRRIAGVGEEGLMALSNDGKSPETLKAELTEFLADGPVIVFTDLSSGSCALAARVCCRGGKGHVVVFGANLPMLLDFVFHRHLPLHELVPRLLERGKESVQSIPEFPDDAHRTVSG